MMGSNAATLAQSASIAREPAIPRAALLRGAFHPSRGFVSADVIGARAAVQGGQLADKSDPRESSWWRTVLRRSSGHVYTVARARRFHLGDELLRPRCPMLVVTAPTLTEWRRQPTIAA